MALLNAERLNGLELDVIAMNSAIGGQRAPLSRRCRSSQLGVGTDDPRLHGALAWGAS